MSLIGVIAGAARRRAVVGVDYAPLILSRTSLIGYWRLGEASGATAADETEGSPGTYVGGPTLGVAGAISGDADTAMRTAGSEYMNANMVPPTGASQRTIECWARPTTIDGTERYIFGYGASGGGNGFSAAIENVSSAPHLLFRHISGNIRFPWSASTGAWVHVCMVVPSGASTTDDVLVYLNGSAVSGTRNSGSNQTLNTGSSDVFFARTSSPSASPGGYQGDIDEAAVYDAALTAAQIAEHYAAGTGA